MHLHAALLDRFFAAFAREPQPDPAGMQACLHEDVEFSDIGFQLKGKRQVGAMWQMICENGIQVTYRGIRADDRSGSAHWECDYQFREREGARPRPVHNGIDSRFTFQDGLIREHHDSCKFWPWARQALGWKGLLLGWTPLMRPIVRKKAAEKLERFMAKRRK